MFYICTYYRNIHLPNNAITIKTNVNLRKPDSILAIQFRVFLFPTTLFGFQSFDFASAWWSLFRKHVVCIYIYIYISIKDGSSEWGKKLKKIYLSIRVLYIFMDTHTFLLSEIMRSCKYFPSKVPTLTYNGMSSVVIKKRNWEIYFEYRKRLGFPPSLSKRMDS